ncbi:MAG: hypothetical protein ACYTAN_07565 [Planctomycetota bacterium]|jgi:hypothetical protein
MTALARTLAAMAILTAGAFLAAAATGETGATPQTQVAKAETAPSPESLLGDPYMLTWEKDPRFKGREPFQTVLHFVGKETRLSDTFRLPRTPSEETSFVLKADSYVEEALDALEHSDFKFAEERLETVKRMSEVKLVSQSAKDRMAAVVRQLAEAEKQLVSVRARAALKEALEIAARMQAYFDGNRHGEVLGLHQKLLELDDERGLKNPEVASTAAGIAEMCARLADRSTIHLEFGQMGLAIDAVSHYPEGRSYAIVNGEVIGEGGLVAPDLAIASVEGPKVVFNYKGEQIPLLLAE